MCRKCRLLRCNTHYKAFFLRRATLITADGPGPSIAPARIARTRQRAGKRAGGGFPVSGERAKVTEMGEWVEITDLHDFDMTLCIV